MNDYAIASADAGLRALLRDAVRDAGAAEGSVLLLSEDGHALQFVLCQSPVADKLLGLRQPLGKGITGLSFSLQQPMVVNNVAQDTAFDPTVQQHTAVVTHSIMVVPLVSPGGEFGALTAVNSDHPGGFSAADLAAFGEAARLITERLTALQLTLPSPNDGTFE